MLHACVSTSSPGQSIPPNTGLGFVQDRVRVNSPPPHVFEQVLQDVHSVHRPSTKSNGFKINFHIFAFEDIL